MMRWRTKPGPGLTGEPISWGLLGPSRPAATAPVEEWERYSYAQIARWRAWAITEQDRAASAALEANARVLAQVLRQEALTTPGRACAMRCTLNRIVSRLRGKTRPDTTCT